MSNGKAKETDSLLPKTDLTSGTDEKLSENEEGCLALACEPIINFYKANALLFGIIFAIMLAYVYPPLGAIYFFPEITATWVAVVFIFVMTGLGLKTEEFSKAFKQIWFNLFCQFYNFIVVSYIVFEISRYLISSNIVSQALGDGMVIGACLPMTVTMSIVLTKSSNGDEAVAVFNAATQNLIGVFLTPTLILMYLGVTGGDIDLADVFIKLSLKVVAPIIVGQVLQSVKSVANFVKMNKPLLIKMRERCLVFIVYTVFCTTFQGDNSGFGLSDAIVIFVVQLFLVVSFTILCWFLMKLFFSETPKLRATGVFGCTHKTVALGVPLINAIYASNPNVGFYTLPLLVWHPIQLILGTALAPRLSNFVKEEEDRLKSLKTSPITDV